MKELALAVQIQATPADPSEPEGYPRPSLRAVWSSWEWYVVLAVAAFLRLYDLHTTIFNLDQAAIFQMAYHAAHNGWLVAANQPTSIGTYNPPATIYILMPVAAFTSDPLWGAIETGCLMTVTVLLTYLFVRRYFGRGAATVAALSYATALRAVIYARFIWEPNLLPLVVVPLVIFLLQGTMARKSGWLAPALLCLGLALQFHGTAVYLAIPLLVACLLAPCTVRKRDVALGVLYLLLIYAPTLLWEFSTGLIDLKPLLHAMHLHASVDSSALHYYTFLLNPYDLLSSHNPYHWHIGPFLGEQSLLGTLAPYLTWISDGTLVLLVLVMALLVVLALYTRSQGTAGETALAYLRGYWRDLRKSPLRCGLLVLLSWQIIPLLLLTRHVELWMHYFIFLLPGPFVLLGIGMSRTASWLRTRQTGPFTGNVWSGAVYLLATVIILAQFLGATAGVLDLNRGNYDDGARIPDLWNDLQSLQNAVKQTDQLAQALHLSRVYISTDWPTQTTLRYLATQMRTPVTLFDQSCAVLPGADEGAAAMLVGPYSPFVDTLLKHFAIADLVASPARLTGSPFHLYIVKTQPLAALPQSTLGHDLQRLDTPAQTLQINNATWLVSQWRLLRSAQPGYRQVYGYNVEQTDVAQGQPAESTQCTFTAMRAGDQLLVPLQQKQSDAGPLIAAVNLQAGSYETYPYYLHVGPLTFETYDDITTAPVTLKTAGGQSQLAVPVSGF